MASEEFRREVVVAADIQTTWQVLTEVDTLVDWIQIIDELVQQTHLERYSAVLMDRIGPFKLRADLDIWVSEVVDGERLRVRAAGEDRQVSSRIEIDVVLEISESPALDAVTVTIGGSYQVTGKVATMGGGMIRQKATKVLDQFVARASDRLGKV